MYAYVVCIHITRAQLKIVVKIDRKYSLSLFFPLSLKLLRTQPNGQSIEPFGQEHSSNKVFNGSPIGLHSLAQS